MGPKLYDSEHVERFADDQFYAFTRGDKGEVNTFTLLVLWLLVFIFFGGGFKFSFVYTTSPQKVVIMILVQNLYRYSLQQLILDQDKL